MKRIINKIKFTFFAIPKTLAEQVNQNTSKIGFLTFIMMLIMVIMGFIGKLPMWSILK